MVQAGYSPSVRLFEAAACASTIISDNWPGLDGFFTPNQEILLPSTSDEVVRLVREAESGEMRAIGERAQQRVLAEHTSDKRAEEFEALLGEDISGKTHDEKESAAALSSVPA